MFKNCVGYSLFIYFIQYVYSFIGFWLDWPLFISHVHLNVHLGRSTYFLYFCPEKIRPVVQIMASNQKNKAKNSNNSN